MPNNKTSKKHLFYGTNTEAPDYDYLPISS